MKTRESPHLAWWLSIQMDPLSLGLCLSGGWSHPGFLAGLCWEEGGSVGGLAGGHQGKLKKRELWGCSALVLAPWGTNI